MRSSRGQCIYYYPCIKRHQFYNTPMSRGSKTLPKEISTVQESNPGPFTWESRVLISIPQQCQTPLKFYPHPSQPTHFWHRIILFTFLVTNILTLINFHADLFSDDFYNGTSNISIIEKQIFAYLQHYKHLSGKNAGRRPRLLP